MAGFGHYCPERGTQDLGRLKRIRLAQLVFLVQILSVSGFDPVIRNSDHISYSFKFDTLCKASSHLRILTLGLIRRLSFHPSFATWKSSSTVLPLVFLNVKYDAKIHQLNAGARRERLACRWLSVVVCWLKGSASTW